MEKTCNSVLSKAQIQCFINKKETGHMTNEYCHVFDSVPFQEELINTEEKLTNLFPEYQLYWTMLVDKVI